ncbi:MAG: glycine--tRNA ligase subunit beta [Chthonomonadaceae bacterium]|nr:glycine--tRNA ligase subunit beta [Chthonomonadaceae bacterium]
MPDLLLELGCEELPASFVRKAADDLQSHVEERLREAGIGFERTQKPLSTPRRLIVHLAAVDARQPDQTKEMRGPAVKAAYDGEGNPTGALQGFCRGQGVDPKDVRQEGDYVWVTKTLEGRPTAEVLSELLPDAIRALTFEKSMRWGESRMRFARPIRWILAVFDGEVVPFSIEGVEAGATSRGHRFNHPEPFEARTLDALLNGLLARQVEPDPAERETRIREGATIAASGTPDLTDALVDENVFLTEWPTAIEGAFKPEFMELPEPVLVTAMAKHQRFFPVRDGKGALTNRFISIRNGGEDAVVREGNAWVLNARFNDAKFFFDDDQKHDLAQFLERTRGIVFQDKLGTVRQRADRLAALTAGVAAHFGAGSDEQKLAEQAGHLAKADLSTGLVSELPSLQGVVGSEYARREGVPESVCGALAAHYDLTRCTPPASPDARLGLFLLVADQLDRLAGNLGIGLVPTGSSDPNGLRRAATLVLEATWAWPDRVPSLLHLFHQALNLYERQGVDLDLAAASAALGDVLSSRYEALLASSRHDQVQAAILADSLEALASPDDVKTRLAAVGALAADEAFVQTATRPLNILAAADKKQVPYHKEAPLATLDRAHLASPEGEALADALGPAGDAATQAVHRQDAKALTAALKPLEVPINAFFEATMVMSENEQERYVRLSLVAAAAEVLRLGGDWSKLEG